MKNFLSWLTVVFLAGGIAACGNSRNESYWLDKENEWNTSIAYRVCAGKKVSGKYAGRLSRLDPPFSRKDECQTVDKVWPEIEKRMAQEELDKLIKTGSVQDFYKGWEQCAVYNYVGANRAYCDKITPVYRTKALAMIPDGESWDENKLSQQRSQCIEQASMGGADWMRIKQGQERVDYCASLHLFLDDIIRKRDATQIAAWNKKIDEFVAMSSSEFQSMTQTPCGRIGSGNGGVGTRRSMSRARRVIYDWDDCSAYVESLDARNRN